MSEISLGNCSEVKVKPFGMGDKVGYAMGDVGCGVFFQFVSTYLMLFYTDILGISAVAVGTLFIVARVWDAVNDPIMGVIVDKKKRTENGKFRPYIVKFGIPMVIVGIIAFTNIPMADSMKIPFAYITYITFGMLYTAVNIPYGSLASVMTSDPIERTSLSTFRNLGSMISGMIIMVVGPMLLFGADGKVTSNGFFVSAVIFAIISSISFILTFKLTRERIVHKEQVGKKVTIKQAIKSLGKNRAFVGISIASAAVLASMFVGVSLNAYLFKEYFNAPHLLTLAGMAGMVPSLLVMPFAGKLVKRFGKKEISVFGTAFALVMYIILFVATIENPYVYIGLVTLAGLGNGLVMVVTWALIGDAIDYQEYISGERNEGLVYSSYSLFRKLAQAVSGGVGGFALGMLGYEAGVATQAEGIGLGIKNIICGANVIGLGISLIALMYIYNLSKGKLEEVTNTLNERRMANS